MKKIITLSMALFIILLVHAQPNPTPSTDGIYCPLVNRTFTYYVLQTSDSYDGFRAEGEAVPGVSGSYPVQIFGTPAVTNDGTYFILTFTGYFADRNVPQGIRITYRKNGVDQPSLHYNYAKIASFYQVDPMGANTPHPSPTSIQAVICTSQTFNITVPNVNYKDLVATPALTYGPVSTFEYLLPAGWQLGSSTVSDGVTWISSTNNVSVTSDLTHGGSIQVRPAACGANLTPGPATAIPISRPGPTLSVTSTGGGVFCAGDTRVFSVNGMPAGSTVTWSAAPTGIVTINAPSASQTTLTKTGVGLVTLIATVTTSCGNTFTANSSVITVGSPAPTDIAKGPSTSTDVEVTCPAVPGATSYNWLMNGTLMTEHSTECDMFPVSCRQTFLACVSAINACGASSNYCESITNTPCLGGSGTFVVSPNPASSVINVTAVPEVSSKNNTAAKVNKAFNEVRIYDQQGTLKKRLVYHNANQASVDVSTLSTGTYFIEIVNGSNVDRQAVIIRK